MKASNKWLYIFLFSTPDRNAEVMREGRRVSWPTAMKLQLPMKNLCNLASVSPTWTVWNQSLLAPKNYLLCWWVFCQLDTSLSHFEKCQPQFKKNAFIRVARRQVCEAFSYLMIDVRGSSPVWVMPPLKRWTWVVILKGTPSKSWKTSSGILSWSLLPFLTPGSCLDS